MNNYRLINSLGDQIISDADTQQILGMRTDQGVETLFAAPVLIALSIKTFIPDNQQQVVYGGVTVSGSGYIKCGGEVVAVNY